MNERRIKRLQELIKARVAEVVSFELADPRRGLITITKVELDRELAQCKVYWSVLGDEKERNLNAHMLDHATSYVQREVAAILHTRTVPRVRFVFDESIAGAIRVQRIIDELRDERRRREGGADAKTDTEGESPA
jgi:ribosome-binding factor A